jgi:glyoxylase-like metal-dependent hydrolase (beta-lactamase superfamily II)
MAQNILCQRNEDFGGSNMPVTKGKTASLSIERFASSEAGAWSNAYLVSSGSEAVLFDVSMLHSDAARLAELVRTSGKTLKAVMISHAHPDHFMGLDVIKDRFPDTRIVSTGNVVADVKADGPWMFSMLHDKLGEEAPTRLVVPDVLEEPALFIEGTKLEVVEFGECESKHIAAVYIEASKALLSADLVYNHAHLYLQERHLQSWLARLDELEAFAKDRVATIYPGHGEAASLELIAQTRAYLSDFAEATKTGNANTAEQYMLSRYPDYHVRQFLTAFSIPSYFPAAAS